MPVWLVLTLGVAAISSAAILVRLLPTIPAVAIAAWRLTFAALITLPIAYSRRELKYPGMRMSAAGMLGGAFLALHFFLWFSSLKMTTVASSVVLGTTTPIWVSLVSHFFLGEKLSQREWLGITVAVIGGFFVGAGDISLSSQHLLGDLVALISAWAISIYFLIGRNLRKQLSLLNYTSIVYTTAAIVLMVFTLLSGISPISFTMRDYFILFMLAVFPQLIGHNSLNWALARLKASLVTVSVLGEAVLSGIAAAIIFGEIPEPLAIPGYILIMLGIYLSTSKSTI